jgi:chromate reductase
MTKIAVIVGSIRADSLNKKLAKNLEALAPEGTEFLYADISTLPLFNQDVESANYPEAAQAIKDIVAESDAILFVTPEYNHSFTGVLKNAIDWVSRPWGVNSWGDKLTGIVGASISPNGTKFAQAALADIVEWFKSPIYTDQEIKFVVTEETFDSEGMLIDAAKDTAKAYIEGFVDWVKENPNKPE